MVVMKGRISMSETAFVLLLGFIVCSEAHGH